MSNFGNYSSSLLTNLSLTPELRCRTHKLIKIFHLHIFGLSELTKVIRSIVIKCFLYHLQICPETFEFLDLIEIDLIVFHL